MLPARGKGGLSLDCLKQSVFFFHTFQTEVKFSVGTVVPAKRLRVYQIIYK